MMRSGAVDRNTGRTRGSLPAAPPQPRGERRADDRLARFEACAAELARSLTRVDATDLEAALAPTLETLGLGLGADRVVFFAAPGLASNGLAAPRTNEAPACGTGGFRQHASWTRSGPPRRDASPGESLDLDRLPDGGRALRAGEPLRVSGGRSWQQRATRAGTPSRSRSLPERALLYLPCGSPGRLTGIFAVESEAPVTRSHDRLLVRARAVVDQFAIAFDRHRLACELAELRARDGHDERLETLGRIATGVAHDFNNVLTAILGYSDLLELEIAEGGDGARELAEIREAADRAGELVDQVLAFGRPRPTGPQTVDLAGCVTRLAGMIERVLGKRIDLELDLGPRGDAAGSHPGEAERVRIDPSRIERVLLNLASNARAALGAETRDPRFTIALQRVVVDREGRDPEDAEGASIASLAPGPHLRLTARDNGCGIDPALRERIFEPFFTTREACGGTGLGLATIAEIVRGAGGGIRVESAPGRGSAFHLYFPLAPIAAIASPEAPEAPAAERVSCGDESASGLRLDPHPPSV